MWETERWQQYNLTTDERNVLLRIIEGKSQSEVDSATGMRLHTIIDAQIRGQQPG